MHEKNKARERNKRFRGIFSELFEIMDIIIIVASIVSIVVPIFSSSMRKHMPYLVRPGSIWCGNKKSHGVPLVLRLQNFYDVIRLA